MIMGEEGVAADIPIGTSFHVFSGPQKPPTNCRPFASGVALACWEILKYYSLFGNSSDCDSRLSRSALS